MMERHPLETILAPRSVAFLGASDSLLTMGTVQLYNIASGGFKGPIYPVHPKLKTVLGHKAYPSIADLPDGVDAVVMVLPTRIVPQMLEECGKKGITRGTVISGGFSEVGGNGRELEKQVREVSAKYGLKFNGPNCIGVCNPNHGYNNTWFPYEGAPGPIGLASQSGTYACHSFNHVKNLGTGFSRVVSVGNEVTLDLVDCLEYFEDDEDTKAIALYVEGIRRGRDFIRVARRVAKKKPIVALYVGGTEAGARAGASHTAVLSGPDEVYEGAFEQAGVLRAANYEQLFDWCWVLSTQPCLNGKKLGIVTNSGGPGSSFADAANRLGLDIPPLSKELQETLRAAIPGTASPRNPVDITYAVNMQNLIMDKIPNLLLKSNEIDGLLVYGLFAADVFIKYAVGMGLDLPISNEQMHELDEKASVKFGKIADETGKPIIGATFFTRDDDALIRRIQECGVPMLPSPERAASAMAALYRYGRIRERLA